MSKCSTGRANSPEMEQAVLDYLEEQSEERLGAIFEVAQGVVHHFGNLYSGGRVSEDLIQAGYEGLLKAIYRYEPDRGVRFITFASHYIMGEMKHQLRQEASFDRPGWVADLQSHIYRTAEDLSSSR